jgi:hypothetical protein
MERPVSRSRERSAGQQRELRLTEERPPRPMARAALTSDARRKGGGSEWRSHVLVRTDWSERIVPQGLWTARGAGSRGPAPKGGSERAGGRGHRLVRRSEVSRVDHVTVDNAVLDTPKRSLHPRWSALEKPKLESRRQPRSTWYENPTLSGGFPRKGASGLGKHAHDLPQGEPRFAQRARLGSARLRSRATGPLVDVLFGESSRVGSGAAPGGALGLVRGCSTGATVGATRA